MVLPAIVKAALVFGSLFYGHKIARDRARQLEEAQRAQREALETAAGIEFRPTFSNTNIPQAYGLCRIAGIPAFVDVLDSFSVSGRAQPLVVRKYYQYYSSNGCGGQIITTQNNQLLFFDRDSVKFAVGESYNVGALTGPKATVTKVERKSQSWSRSEGGGENRQCVSYTDYYNLVTFDKTELPSGTKYLYPFSDRLDGLFGGLAEGSGANQYLLAQYALARGEQRGLIVGGVEDYDVEDTRFKDVMVIETIVPVVDQDAKIIDSEASSLATELSDKRSANENFYGSSYATGVFRRSASDVDSPFSTGIPPISYYSSGKITALTNGHVADVIHDVLRDNVTDNEIEIGCFNITLPSFTKRNFEGRINEGVASRKLYAYEYNGLIPTDINVRERINMILSSCPGLFVFKQWDGQYCLSAPFNLTSKATFTDGDLLPDDEVIYTDPHGYNACEVSYANCEQDFASDTARWSNAIAGDYERVLNIDAKGTCWEVHAKNIARWNVFASQRAAYEFTLASHALDYKIGDVVTLDSSRYGHNVLVRIQSMTMRADLNTRITAAEYVPSDWVFDSNI